MSAPHDDSKLLLDLLAASDSISAEQFETLIQRLDNHRVLAKLCILEGTPAVFKGNALKYVIFREQLADRFGVGSQDVCIVGSAKLGFSIAPTQFGVPFTHTSDVDVVLISEEIFNRGSHDLFTYLRDSPPSSQDVRNYCYGDAPNEPAVDFWELKKVQEAVRNFSFDNFNPGLLPDSHPLRREIFDKISTAAGLFLALQPSVAVSKIRARIFKTWKAAEDYYTNSLREAKRFFTSRRGRNIVPTPQQQEFKETAAAIGSPQIQPDDGDLVASDTDFQQQKATSIQQTASQQGETLQAGRLQITVFRAISYMTAVGRFSPSMSEIPQISIIPDKGTEGILHWKLGKVSPFAFWLHARSRNGFRIEPADYSFDYTARLMRPE
jgi:hypothetical protein